MTPAAMTVDTDNGGARNAMRTGMLPTQGDTAVSSSSEPAAAR